MISYVVLLGFVAVLSALPLRLALALGRACGWFAFAVLRIRRRVVLENLRYTLGSERTPAELERIAARTYANWAMTVVEVLRSSSGHDRDILPNVDYPPLDVFDEAQAEGTPW